LLELVVGAAIREKINVCDKIVTENKKKGRNVEIKKLLRKSPSKNGLEMEFTAC